MSDRFIWQVYRRFTDINSEGYVQRQNLGCYPSDEEMSKAVRFYKSRYPDSYVAAEKSFY